MSNVWCGGVVTWQLPIGAKFVGGQLARVRHRFRLLQSAALLPGEYFLGRFLSVPMSTYLEG